MVIREKFDVWMAISKKIVCLFIGIVSQRTSGHSNHNDLFNFRLNTTTLFQQFGREIIEIIIEIDSKHSTLAAASFRFWFRDFDFDFDVPGRKEVPGLLEKEFHS